MSVEDLRNEREQPDPPLISNAPVEALESGASGGGSPKVEAAGPSGGAVTEGVYTKIIGSGENAKDTFVYIVIVWSFIVGSVISSAIYVKSYFAPMDSGGDLVALFKDVWGIFFPIITLALGYSFGKGR
ncbi:hypothetical protein [Pseudomonas sp. S1(2024)]|uniref:hypothetical protein n=1 Tax=Pseudomonas sp. S1(2024) TaxID=3390191 RepID=UPI00397E7048